MFKFVHAKQPSDVVNPARTTGVEVTDAAVADRCWMGNIDGQHSMGTPSEWQGKAAIQIAMCLDVQVPFAGTTFATSRPDVDSIGAMAVLVVRALGRSDQVNQNIVREIAHADAFKPSATWHPKPLPTEDNPWPTGAAPVDANPDTAYLGLICSPRRGDVTESLTLAQRVLVVIGELAGRNVQYEAEQFLGEKLPALPTEWRKSVHMIAPSPWASLALHLVAESRRALARAAQEPGAVEVLLSATDGGLPARLDIVDIARFGQQGWSGRTAVAIVRVAHAGALGLGYCVAPVVVAIDPATERWCVQQFRNDQWGRPDAPGDRYAREFVSADEAERAANAFVGELQFIGEQPKPNVRVVRRVKATIAPYSPKHLDFHALRDELNRLEAEAGGDPKWGGGTSGITGSPLHVGTILSDDAIVNTVRRFLK